MINFNDYFLLQEARWEDVVRRLAKQYNTGRNNWTDWTVHHGMQSAVGIHPEDTPLSVTEAEFTQIARFDPTVERGRKGNYIEWMIHAIQMGVDAGQMDVPESSDMWHAWDDGVQFTEALKKFDQYKNRRAWAPYPKNLREGNRWTMDTLSQLQEAIEEFEQREGIASQRAADADPYDVAGTRFIVEDGDWKVYQVLTYEGSLTFCSAAGWCVDDEHTFDRTYGPEHGNLYIFRHKDKSIALAFHSIYNSSDHEFKERFNKPIRPHIAQAILPLALQVPHINQVIKELSGKVKELTKIITDREGIDILRVSADDIGAHSYHYQSDISFMKLAAQIRKVFKSEDYIEKLALRVLREHRDQQPNIIGLTTLRKMEALHDKKNWFKEATKLMFLDGAFMNSIRYNMNHGNAKTTNPSQWNAILKLMIRPYGYDGHGSSINDYALLIPAFAELAQRYNLHDRDIHTPIGSPLQAIWNEKVRKAILSEIKQKLSERLGIENWIFRLMMEKAGLYTIVIRGLLKNKTFKAYVEGKVFNTQAATREHNHKVKIAIKKASEARQVEYEKVWREVARKHEAGELDDELVDDIARIRADWEDKYPSVPHHVENPNRQGHHYVARALMKKKYHQKTKMVGRVEKTYHWMHPWEQDDDVQEILTKMNQTWKRGATASEDRRNREAVGESFEEYINNSYDA